MHKTWCRALLFVLLTLNCLDALYAQDTHPLIQWMISQKRLGSNFKSELQKYVDPKGRVTETLQNAITKIESAYSSGFTEEDWSIFQEALAEIGAKTKKDLQIPKNRTPLWLLKKGPLFNFRSSVHLPKEADIVVVGAGLTGASAAFHLSDLAKEGKNIVVLERDQVAFVSSGKNGGNFQLLPEGYLERYDGMVKEREKWISQKKPGLSKDIIHELAHKEADILFAFSYKNSLRFINIVEQEQIDCDFSSAGWLKIASSGSEEQALHTDSNWLNQKTKKADFEVWSPEKIENTIGIKNSYVGRFVPKNGNYHPYKFVTEVLRRSIDKGVKLYTRIRVLKIQSLDNGEIKITTDNGIIITKKVIVATNTHTPELFPDLSAIVTHESYIINLEHVKNNLKGMTVTERQGDIYYNFPKSLNYQINNEERGLLHYGLDFDENLPLKNPEERFRHQFSAIKKFTDERYPETKGQPASRFWSGPMGFTADRVPMIGFYHPKGAKTQNNIVVAAAFQGYGGSFCMQAGYVAAEMAQSGTTHPDTPEHMFSPHRFD